MPRTDGGAPTAVAALQKRGRPKLREISVSGVVQDRAPSRQRRERGKGGGGDDGVGEGGRRRGCRPEGESDAGARLPAGWWG